jgi:hypothetical protein
MCVHGFHSLKKKISAVRTQIYSYFSHLRYYKLVSDVLVILETRNCRFEVEDVVDIGCQQAALLNRVENVISFSEKKKSVIQ